MTDIDFPFHVDSAGRTARTGSDEHVRDMIEQLLLTGPGERVNRPEFGCGLLQLVFEPNSLELAAALQLAVEAALQLWLGDVVDAGNVLVDSVDGTLQVTVSYTVRASGEPYEVRFAAGAAT